MPVATRYILDDVVAVLLGRKVKASREAPTPELLKTLLDQAKVDEKAYAIGLLGFTPNTFAFEPQQRLVSEFADLFLARNMHPSHMTMARDLAQVIATATPEERTYAENFFGQLLGRVDGVKATEPEPKESEEELRAAMLVHRYSKHQVTDQHTLVLLQDYKPNLANMPDGWLKMGDPRTGRLYNLYFKLYTQAQFNPQPESKHFRPQGYEAAGPNRGYGLEVVHNGTGQEEYLYRTIRRNLALCLQNDELELLEVVFRPSHEITPIDPIHHDEFDFFMEGGIRVSVGGRMEQGRDIVSICTQHGSGADASQFTVGVDLYLPDEADLTGIDLYAIANRIAQFHCVSYPRYVGSGNLILTSYRFAPKLEGKPFANGRASAMYAIEPLHISIPL